MKLASILFLIVLLGSSCSNSNNIKSSLCSELHQKINIVESDYAKGIYWYPALQVIVTKTERKIKHNETIQYIIDKTGIKPAESLNGMYQLTDSVILLWKKWVYSNCESYQTLK